MFAKKSLRAGRGREQAIEEGSNSQRPSELLFLSLQDLLRNGRIDNIRKGNLVKPNQALVAAARRPPPTQLEVLTMTHILRQFTLQTSQTPSKVQTLLHLQVSVSTRWIQSIWYPPKSFGSSTLATMLVGQVAILHRSQQWQAW